LLARGALAPALRREARWLRRWAARFAESVRCDGAEAAAVADVDHDGRPELLLVGTDGIRCGRFEGGRWRELARGPLPDAMGTIEACLGGDVLGDGRDELVVAGGDRQLGRSLRVFRIERTGERLSLRTMARLPLAAHADAAGLALARTGAASGGELLVARAAEGGRQGWRVQLGPEGELLTRALCGALAPLARVEAVAAADVDGDGRDEALVGTRGPGGRDVRLGESAASPAGGTRWRRRIGAVEAIVPVDLDRDGALDLALGLDRSADRSTGRSWPPASVVVLDAGLTARPGRRTIVPLVPAEPQRWSARFAALLAADLHASGAPALCALVQTWRTDHGASPPRRRLLVCCERADDRLRVLRIVLPEGTFGWALTADLDLDGDDELVFGGPRQAVVVGLRRRGP
ncbi:MAG: VCBS repeat-containing protein, partial [Planctomycetota bacterium]